ncbi:MAG: gfo/Idh/MocA family oxidoreductase, partial [Deltaproteobacteria bacterium]|nr:gfo/Idh/MocA family oxidoreductase [Deltaproteobacteria bacterium]
YRRENAPEGSTMRCTEGCTIERTCPHSALRIYLDLAPFRDWNLDPAWPDVWPINVITDDLTRAGRQSALARGPWGRCVYRCDNDVVDHQQVTLDIEDGGVATLTVVGHSAREGRSLRYDGTHGTVRGRFASANAELEICAHGGACETIRFDTHHDDHGGGDEGLMRAFVAALRGGPPLAGAQELLESHLLAFAADRARLSRESVDLPTFRAEAETAPAK